MRQIEQLYREHGPALLVYLRRSFGRSDAAPEDLLQETFVQAIRGKDRLAAAVSPRAWLFGIARHVGLSAVRKLRLVETIDEQRTAAKETDSQVAAMREAIEQLPAAMREVVQLRLREGLSYDEIAQVLEIPIGTVRSRLHSAMKLLREAMAVDQPNRSAGDGQADS
jgi:RNA polymerase sigma-70 factor, ECF subfamily